MLTVNTNINAIKLQNNLSKVSNALDSAYVKLSTGYKINSAADGAADLMLSKGLETQISGLSVCNDNAQMAKNLLTVADGVLEEVTSIAQRLRDLALTASNGMYSLVERVAFQQEADALVDELKRQVSEARFNQYKLFKDETAGSGASPASYSLGGSEPAYGGVDYGVMAASEPVAGEPAAASEPMMYAASPAMASEPMMAAAGPVMTQAEAEAAGYTWVTTADQLQFALLNNESVALGGNINLEGYDWENIEEYTGTFEGNNYTISNLTDDQGLFETIGALYYDEYENPCYQGATIKDLKLQNFNITSTSDDVGALVGRSTSPGSYITNYSEINIDNIQVIGGTVTGKNQVGGLIGNTEAGTDTCIGINITNSTSSAIVSGSENVGGLIGRLFDNFNGTYVENCSTSGNVSGITNVGSFVGEVETIAGTVYIQDCYATGNATGETNIGGLIGKTNAALGYRTGSIELTNCYSTGNVKGSDGTAGGLVGYASTSGSESDYETSYIAITNCSSSSTVEGETAGGLIGFGTRDEAASFTISDSSATGDVTSNGRAGGGLAGSMISSSISNSYATGSVSGSGDLGGLIGVMDSGTIEASCATGNVSGSGNLGGFAGATSPSAIISDSYSTGNIQGSNASGFVGNNAGTVTNSYYNLANGTNDSSGAMGQDESWFTPENLAGAGITVAPPTPTPPGGGGVSGGTGSITFQIGTHAGELNTISVDMEFEVGAFYVDFMSETSARNTLNEIDNLIQKITKIQGNIGVSSNIVDSVIDNNTQTQINLEASKSRIIDADIAHESSEFIKCQIRQNMTASLLTQTTNNLGPIALGLLRF